MPVLTNKGCIKYLRSAVCLQNFSTKLSIVDKIAFLLRRNIRNFKLTNHMLDTHLFDISGAKDFFESVKERVVAGLGY